MRRRQRLALPVLALGLMSISGAVAAPASADPPEIATGYIVIDPQTFVFVREESTGAVGRFSFGFQATVFGDLAGTTVESYDCQEVGDVVRCRGGGTTVGADGSKGTFKVRLTCTPLPELVCEGKSQGRGFTADGERLIWMTDVSPAGPFRSTYAARVVQGPA